MDKERYIAMALPYRLKIYNNWLADDTITLELRYEGKGVGSTISKQCIEKSAIDLIAYEVNDMKRELNQMTKPTII